MPTDGAALGLNTAWFAEALATATVRTVAHSSFSIVSPVAFLATKFVAFIDRGKGDLYASKDLEDFMAVVDVAGTSWTRLTLLRHHYGTTSSTPFVISWADLG